MTTTAARGHRRLLNGRRQIHPAQMGGRGGSALSLVGGRRETALVAAAGDPLDEALELARHGDEASFRAIWCELQPRLLRYLGVIGATDIEDTASETWIRVVRDLHKFKGDGRAFRSWVFTVARHRAIDGLRYRLRLRRRPGRLEAPGVAPSAEDETAEALSTEQALRLVATLPRRQAEAVALRVIADLDTEAAARIAGMSPEALRVNLHRGMRALARHPLLAAQQETAV